MIFADLYLNFYIETHNSKKSIKMKYFNNNNFIYTKKISMEQYLKKIKYTKKQLLDLYKSGYPTQVNKYVLLKFPLHMTKVIKKEIANGDHKWNPQVNKNTVISTIPCDYKLCELVKFFWKYKLITHGWNQPDNKNNGFISFSYKTADGKNAIDVIKTIISKFELYHISIRIFYYFLTIQFSEKELIDLYTKFNLKMTNKKDSLKGSIFRWEYLLVGENDINIK